MNGFGVALLCSALQVTLLALAALVCSTLAMRRAPATAVRLTVLAFLGSGVLTAMAFCPLPDWWSWKTPQTDITAQTPSPSLNVPGMEAVSIEHGAAANADDTALVGHLQKTLPNPWWPKLWTAAEPVLQAGNRRPSWLVLFFLGGVILSSLRPLLAVWAVSRCRRRSKPIADLALHQLLKQLCGEMGLSVAVELRETPDLTTPATIGWLRPTVLLPPEWRTWTAEDCRAVLAHELAHVQRRDYLAWLMAQVMLALHFYHPLFYWLAARLRLQQELAADALANQHAGSTGNYLRALARLALRQDNRHGVIPTLAFLSSPGTLLRRIAMLRATDGRPCRLLPRGLRVAGFLFLVAVALGVSALRAPAEKPVAPETPKVKSLENSPVEPFDLSYLATDTNMVMAFHPAAIFGPPEMKQNLEAANKALTEILKQFCPDGKVPLNMEDIEQLVVSGPIHTDKTAKQGKGQTSLLFHMLVIHTTKDVDWKNVLTNLAGEMKEVQIEGKTCYEPAKNELIKYLIGFGRSSACFYVPDRRTVVFDSKEAIGDMLRARAKETPPPAWREDWKRVENGLMAILITDTSVLNERPEPDVKMSKELRAVIRDSSSIALGFGWNDGAICSAIFHAANEKTAEKMVAQLKDQTEQGRHILKKADWKGLEKAQGVYTKFLTNCEITHEGATVTWRVLAKVSFLEALEALIAGEKAL